MKLQIFNKILRDIQYIDENSYEKYCSLGKYFHILAVMSLNNVYEDQNVIIKQIK